MDIRRNMKEKTLILFDIGAVLIKLSYGNFYREAAKHSPLNETEIETAYLKSGLDDRTNRGEVNAKEFMKELKACLQFPSHMTEQQLEKIVDHKFPGEIVEMIDLKRKLHKKGYAVGLLSNIGEEAHKILKERYPEIFAVYNPKNPSILSYQHKVMKPDRRIYDLITGFETVIFIDDKDKYLQVGLEKGWKGIHYTKYPDETEPQRKSHSDTGFANENIRRANSMVDVNKALRDFGVEI